MLNGGTRIALIAIVLIGELLLPSAQVEAKVVSLAPFTPWNVNYGEKICTLRRGFGAKEKPSVIIIDRFGPTDMFQLTVVSDEFKSFEQGKILTLRFGEQKPRRIGSVVPGQTSTKTATLFFGNISLSEMIGDENDGWRPEVTSATEASVQTISISYFSQERTFQTGPLDKAFDALRKCTNDLVTTWGLDPKEQATLLRRPEPHSVPSEWFIPSDYPSAMRNLGKQALVNFRLSVSAQGTPTACEIQSSYNDKKFDELTCAALMRRARFSPHSTQKATPCRRST